MIESIAELRTKCQPKEKSKTDPLLEWHILRPFSIYVTWLAIRLGLNANHVSFLGLFMGVSAGAALMVGSLGWALIAGILAWMSFLLDCVDGEVARYRGSSSMSGTYLDYMVGGVNDVVILLGLSLYVVLQMEWHAQAVLAAGVMLAFLEKVVSLYSHSVVFRNVRSCWNDIEKQPIKDADKLVWPEMSLMARLMRVPLETFFRVNFILIAAVIGYSLGFPEALVIAWVIILILGWVYVVRAFYNEFWGDRVTRNMTGFISALKRSDF